MDRMTPTWIWTLNSQNYRYSIYMYIEYLPQRPKFWSVLLYDYEIQGRQKLEMHQMTPN